MTECPLPDGDHTDDAWWSKHDERIRELEAELAKMDDDFKLFMTDPTARYWHARAEKAEARVAELERMEEHWHNRALLAERLVEQRVEEIAALTKTLIDRNPVFLTGAREREEC